MSSFTDFHVHPISEPREYPVSYLSDNTLYPFLVSGIVNPRGPTLFVVAAVRDKTSSPLALVYAYLNPFRSQLFIPGYLREGQSSAYLPEQILQTLSSFHLFSGGAPTLCIPSGHLDALDVRYLYSHLFANYGRPRSFLERLKRFPLNPWDRVTAEVQEAMESTSANRIEELADVDEVLNDDEMNKLLDTLLDPEHSKNELPAFAYAWKGSIDQQRKLNNNELADSAFQYEDFVPMLAHILDSSGYEPE